MNTVLISTIMQIGLMGMVTDSVTEKTVQPNMPECRNQIEIIKDFYKNEITSNSVYIEKVFNGVRIIDKQTDEIYLYICKEE